jgi:hypothetical protein
MYFILSIFIFFDGYQESFACFVCIGNALIRCVGLIAADCEKRPATERGARLNFNVSVFLFESDAYSEEVSFPGTVLRGTCCEAKFATLPRLMLHRRGFGRTDASSVQAACRIAAHFRLMLPRPEDVRADPSFASLGQECLAFHLLYIPQSSSRLFSQKQLMLPASTLNLMGVLCISLFYCISHRVLLTMIYLSIIL